MKSILISILLINLTACLLAQSDSSKVINPDLDNICGLWIIDLRPNPDSDPYLKDFVIEPLEGNNFKGIFYDTKFENGKFNLNWEEVYFAFTTSDMNNSYYHSGYIKGDEIHGITYSPERDFTMPWTGKKKSDNNN